MKKIICILSLLLLAPNQSYAQNGSSNDIFDLSIETLLDIEVTSVSKKTEKISEAAAAVYVITQEDIRRSGVTSIPEALRMAPGLHVAQMSSNQWAISSRGFNRQFSNKLLVLMDGRTLYTPLFSGVLWDVQDTILEDIDRIEVIRGPGGTLWGANAVNGIINIITKKAKDTQGTLLVAGAGTYDTGFGVVRRGGKTKDGTYYRLYAKHNEREDFLNSDDSKANDNWSISRGGFRTDKKINNRDSLTVQGDVYSGDRNATMILPLASGGTESRDAGEYIKGANILSRWDRQVSKTSHTTLQTYLDLVHRDQALLGVQRATLDIDFNHRKKINDKNEIVWGLGFRQITESLNDSTFLNYTPDRRNDKIFSSFIQEEYTVVPDEWTVTIGSKFERNEYTGFEFQPSAHTAWVINDTQSAWASASRAVRTPSRGEDGLVLKALGTGSGFVTQEGSNDIKSEELVAYEIGYRIEPKPGLSFDATAFYNDYTQLRTFESGSAYVDGDGNVIVPTIADNKARGESFGIEFTSDWQVNNKWKLAGSYSFFTMDINMDDDSSDTTLVNDEKSSPRNLLNVRSYYSFPHQIELDNSLYFVDNVEKADTSAYIRFDTRVGWKPIENVELSLVGQNLFDDRHKEYSKALYSAVEEVPRTMYGKVTISF